MKSTPNLYPCRPQNNIVIRTNRISGVEHLAHCVIFVTCRCAGTFPQKQPRAIDAYVHPMGSNLLDEISISRTQPCFDARTGHFKPTATDRASSDA